MVIAEVAGILLAIDVVMRPRSSQGTIAWLIALIALPIITIPLYVVFGRTRFHGYTEAIREKESLLKGNWNEYFSDMADLANLIPLPSGPIPTNLLLPKAWAS